jgi:hypothetical protein
MCWTRLEVEKLISAITGCCVRGERCQNDKEKSTGSCVIGTRSRC